MNRFAIVATVILLLVSTLAVSAEPPRFSVTSREVFVPTPKTGTYIKAFAYYTAATGVDMKSIYLHQTRSDTFDVAFLRRSTDNGKTWSEPEKLTTHEKTPEGVWRYGYRPGFVDPTNNLLLYFGGKALLKKDKPLEAMTSGAIAYKLSRDGGESNYFEGQVIQAGGEYTAARPLPGVIVGKNAVQAADLGSISIRIRTGEILMPVQITPLGPNGEYYNPGGGYTYHDSAVLIGKWNAEHTLDWTLSERVVADPKLSTRGLLEPTVIEAPDGRILMVMRGSNDTAGKIPGRRWRAISSDHGRTWSKPEPWTYTGDEAFFSPSSCSRLIQHSSGAILWLGNISAKNPRANAPRYPLYIGQVDPDSLQLVKASLLAIDDRQAEDSPLLTLSNFYVYEDRQTHEIVVHYSAVGRQHPLRKPGAGHDWTADAQRVRVKLEL